MFIVDIFRFPENGKHMLHEQDVVVALKVLLAPKWPGYAQLAFSLGMSLSQVHRSINRLIEGRLLVEAEMQVHREHLARFLINGLLHVFPARMREVTRGIPTAWACPLLADSQLIGIVADDLPPVWPDPNGTIKGRAVQPLHDKVTGAIGNDPELYALLSLIDVIRVGRVRERTLAEVEIQKRLAHVRA